MVNDSSKLRIGVLAPGSNFVPFLAGDMLAAIKLGLEETRLNAELIIEPAGYNADLKVLIPAIQKLILSQNVNFIIAPLNVSIIESVAGYCESQGVPLIALNLTEDPLFESAANPGVFVNSFNLWHSAWMSGYLAAQRYGARGAGISPIHDGGYGLMFAFQLGLEAGNGTLIHAAITHRNSSSEDPSGSISEIVAQEPDFIWAAYSGKEAVSFFKTYHALKADKIPLVTIAPGVSQNIRQTAGDAMQNVWFVTGEIYEEEAKSAMDSLANTMGREPNPYSLLAYEAIFLLADAVNNLNKTKNSPENLFEALRQAKFQSPRREVGFNDKLQIDAPFYLRQITENGETVEKHIAPPLLNEQYELACKRLTKQGWVNPYLCA